MLLVSNPIYNRNGSGQILKQVTPLLQNFPLQTKQVPIYILAFLIYELD